MAQLEKRECPRCHGSGLAHAWEFGRDCPQCHGKGTIEVLVEAPKLMRSRANTRNGPELREGFLAVVITLVILVVLGNGHLEPSGLVFGGLIVLCAVSALMGFGRND